MHPYQTLFDAWRDDCLTDEQATELNQLLRESQDARKLFQAEAQFHGLLHCAVIGSVVRATSASISNSKTPLTPRPGTWFQKIPLALAASVGILIGMLCSSIVFAYVVPHSGKSTPLLEDGFETSTVSKDNNATLEFGIWRGTFSERVGEENGVYPASGSKMLRFLRTNYVAKPKRKNQHIADAYLLVDIRPYRHLFSHDGATVDVSAMVNASSFPSEDEYKCGVSIYAIDAETAPKSSLNIGTALTQDSIAMARGRNTNMDRDTMSWQTLSTELRLPSNSEFLVVRLYIAQAVDSPDEPSYPGFYADNLRLTFKQEVPTNDTVLLQ